MMFSWIMRQKQAWQLVTHAEQDQKKGRENAAEEKLREAEKMARVLLADCRELKGENSREFAAFLSDLGSIRSRQGQHVEALKLLERALEIKTNLYGPYHSEVGTGYWELGIACERQGHFEQAEVYLRNAFEVDEQVHGTEHPSVGDECNELGIVNHKLGRLSIALRWLRKAKNIRSKVLNEASHDYQQSWLGIAWTLFNLGRYEECKQELDGLLELTRRTLGEDNPLYGLRLLLYAETLAMMGKPESLETAERVVQLLSEVEHIPQLSLMEARDAALNAKSNIYKMSIMGPCERLLQEGKYQKSEECFQRALDKLSAKDTDVASAILSRLVEVQRRLKHYDTAEQNAKRALKLDREKLVANDTLENLNNAAASLLDVGLVLKEQGKILEADTYYLESERVDRTILQREPGMINAYWRSLTRAGHKSSLGRIREALESGLKSLQSLDPVMIGYERYAIAHSDIGQMFQNVGEHLKAREFTEKAIDILTQIACDNHPQMAKFLSNLGIILSEMFLPEQAKKELIESSQIEIVPETSFMGKMLAEFLGNEMGLEERAFTHDFFLSYNTENEDVAQALHQALEQIGLDVWNFKELDNWQRERPKDEIITESRAQLVRCRALLLVVSGTSLTSNYVLEEVNTALNNNMEIMCWYPEGMRLMPYEASTWSTSNPELIEGVGRSLLQPRVANLFGYRTKENDFTEVARSFLFRLLATYPKHPLHCHYNLENLRNEVRHTTRIARPIFIGKDGNILFPELQKLVP